MRAKSGFTLVEILIVVVILGILAAIVIPQFTEASTEAKTSSLCTDLQTMRSQIELYKIQHNDNKPNMTVDINGDNALTLVTLIDGSVVAAGTANSYGPYIQKIPTNQFTDLNTIRVEAGASTAGAGTHGWVFNTDTGSFHADDTLEHAAL
ncbi:MAG: prepilin-type N-terminal cleavage/methylation domain-containing protein [Planctomycetota bacterium]